MGLDMYLERRFYVKNWDHQKPDQRHSITVKRGGKVHRRIKPERISEIVEEVAYWRKANAIHKWFVDNVQDGKDDCQAYNVSRQQLQALKDACDKVLSATKLKKGKVIANPKIAKTVLPTTDGFFFGSVAYDEGYHADIKETSEVLAALLAEPDGGDFYYRASW